MFMSMLHAEWWNSPDEPVQQWHLGSEDILAGSDDSKGLFEGSDLILRSYLDLA